MDKQVFIKNIAFSEPQKLDELVEYEEGRVVNRTFAQNPSLSLTLFAFDKGEGVSTTQLYSVVNTYISRIEIN